MSHGPATSSAVSPGLVRRPKAVHGLASQHQPKVMKSTLKESTSPFEGRVVRCRARMTASTRRSGWQTSGRLWKSAVRTPQRSPLELDSLPQQISQAEDRSGDPPVASVADPLELSLTSLAPLQRSKSAPSELGRAACGMPVTCRETL